MMASMSSCELSRRDVAAGLVAILLLAAAVRVVYPTADPPSHAFVGIVWHDEGAWVHNARNRALFGAWKLDQWNPMFITPVLTALEYASFSALGVGLRQARLVSEAMGVFSVLLLGLGVARTGGRFAGLIAAALSATNYLYVMYDRAALMEATMVALVVATWYSYTRAERAPVWGLAAGLSAVLAYFTKASAVFFVAALGLDALLSLGGRLAAGEGGVEAGRAPQSAEDQRGSAWILSWKQTGPGQAAVMTLAGLALAGIASLVLFVGPHWHDYWFYNWQMSVTRKPSYSVKAFIDRASWLPIVHDFFTRMWLVSVLAAGAALGMLARWRRLPASERLLLLWVAFGVAELVLHDVGNERRLVLLIPALIALAALALGRDRRLLAPETAQASRRRAFVALPLVLYSLYVICGAILRLPYLYEVGPGARLSAAVALLAGVVIYATWPAVPRQLAAERWSVAGSLVLAALITAGDLAQFAQWASVRTYKNYEAMVAMGRWLPPGTLVHGKLANGLDLENRIRPIFVGRGFGNYEDRTSRDDVRYVLTYVAPSIGYEGPVIQDVLRAYPYWRILRTFDVSETTSGRDQAALIDKGPPGQGVPPGATKGDVPGKGSPSPDNPEASARRSDLVVTRGARRASR